MISSHLGTKTRCGANGVIPRTGENIPCHEVAVTGRRRLECGERAAGVTEREARTHPTVPDAGDRHPHAGSGRVRRGVPQVADEAGEAGGVTAERGGGASRRGHAIENDDNTARCIRPASHVLGRVLLRRQLVSSGFRRQLLQKRVQPVLHDHDAHTRVERRLGHHNPSCRTIQIPPRAE